MRASTYYRAALHRWPAPHDPRVRRLTRRAVGTYGSAVALLELPAERVRIPFKGTTLPGWFFEARTRSGKRRDDAPLLIIHEGRDAWAQDCLYLAEGATQPASTAWSSTGPARAKCFDSRGCHSGRTGSGW